MAKIIIFTLILCLAPIHLSLSQTDENQKELEIVKSLTQLTQDHIFLKSLSGEWKLRGLNKSGQEEVPLTGSVVINPIMNDHYIEMEMSVDEMDIAIKTRLIIGFDSRLKIFTLYSFDDMTNYTNYSTGQREGDKISFSGKEYVIKYKKEIPMKIELNKERENKLTFRIFYTIDKKEKLMIDYQLIRKS